MSGTGMGWDQPWWLLAGIAVAMLAWWAARRSGHPMGPARRRAQVAVRATLALAAAAVLAGPWWAGQGSGRAVVVVLDHSASQGETGRRAQADAVAPVLGALPLGAWTAVVSAAEEPVVVANPRPGVPDPAPAVLEPGGHTDLAAAIDLARGLVPPGAARQVLLAGDGLQTRGDAEAAARACALAGVPVFVLPVAGTVRPDARVARFVASRTRAHEGASIGLLAEIESTVAASAARIRLYENAVLVEERRAALDPAKPLRLDFRRVPAERNLYTYRIAVDGVPGDAVPANDQALALVDVAGRPRVLLLAADLGESRYLGEALAKEGLRIDVRAPGEAPVDAASMAIYDLIALADVPARLLPEATLAALRAYVEDLGGGLLVIGGTNSFGVGGYYRTPLEDLLPVAMESPDQEEEAPVGLCLVIDRSGSMSGDKLELCKSAAIATAGLLKPKDWLGVVVFDSAAEWALPMGRLAAKGEIQSRIGAVAPGGGTDIRPGMAEARAALARAPVKARHMIVLTDGQSEGSGHDRTAAACRAEKITVSTVAVGDDADVAMLQAVATAGGGSFYLAQDPRQVPRIFTQDAMTHLGRLVREVAFRPRRAERHPMVDGWDHAAAPDLLGYVRTLRRTTAQIPLVTDTADPLLATWRFGTGKVTAFTSDCTSRWSGLWLGRWPGGFAQLWSQIARETAREPQGRRLDLRLAMDGATARIEADLQGDDGTWQDGAQVVADVFHVPPQGGDLRPVGGSVLAQEGPGRYRGAFRPDRPGVYLVRARSGGDAVSAGIVHQPGSEAASGRIDRDLLGRIAAASGGKVLAPGETLPEPPPAPGAVLDLRPWLLALALALALADLVLRRWENVLGLVERLRPPRP
jgi:Ca-activated chloride channel family protein